jgi:hypothetical protein
VRGQASTKVHSNGHARCSKLVEIIVVSMSRFTSLQAHIHLFMHVLKPLQACCQFESNLTAQSMGRRCDLVCGCTVTSPTCADRLKRT